MKVYIDLIILLNFIYDFLILTSTSVLLKRNTPLIKIIIGSFIGIKGVLFSLISGSLVGTIVGIPLMLIKGQDTKYGIPFGPFLSFGAIVYIFYGNMFIIMLLNLLRK